MRKVAETTNGILRGGPFPYVWRDNLAELSSAGIGGGGNAPLWATFVGSTGAYSFSASVLKELFITFHIDHDYARGTKLYPHIHWTADTADTGVARWGFEFTVAKGHQQEAFPATTTIYVEQAFTGAAFTHMIGEASEADAIDGETLGIEPDTVVVMRVFRDAADPADTLTAAAFGLFADLHYQADRRGTPFKSPDFYKTP